MYMREPTMTVRSDQRATGGGRRSGRPGFALAVSAILFVALVAVAIPVAALPGGGEAGRLRSDLARMTKLARRGVWPPAQRLTRQLPGEAERLQRLREPASTATAQIRLALDELRQMGALTFDPHYLPALVAAGRAYVAASGQDPLTGTAINSGYAGLEPELAASEARLGRGAADAAGLLARVKRLTRALARSRRRAGRLEHRVNRPRAAAGRRRGDGAR
jgi:hypothetical protein